MSLRKTIAEFTPTFEKVFFSLVFISLLVGYIFSTPETEPLFRKITRSVLVFGGFIYLFILTDWIVRILLGGIAVGLAGSIFGVTVLQTVLIFSIVATGIYFLIMAIKDSLKLGGFELLSFLLGLFLLLPAAMYFIPKEENIEKLYYFGSCFVIATIIYSDNLWLRYTFSQKRLMIYLLVINLTTAIELSLKYI